jgi:hypothetical protein
MAHAILMTPAGHLLFGVITDGGTAREVPLGLVGLVLLGVSAFGGPINSCPDDPLRQVALSRMEGYTNDEIADQLGCARRPTARRSDVIRKT